MSAFSKEIAELKAKVRMMDARLRELEYGPTEDAEEFEGVSPVEQLKIKLIAQARARGDKGPLQARQREFGMRVKNGQR